jgi:lipoate-protein ligase A
MAVDETLLERVGRHESLPALRLYAWDPACISLGFAQSFSDVDLPALQQARCDVVRRVTGGRAILHTDELTYSVVGPLREPRLYGTILESYGRLASALLHSLLQLGLPAVSQSKYPSQPGSSPQGPVCFEVPSNYEITVHGKKLIGSAQARRKEGVLQHGSLPLGGDITRIIQMLVYPSQREREEAARRLDGRATTVEAVLQKRITWEAAAQAMAAAFRDCLNLELIESELTPEELDRVKVLVKEKYAHPSWNERI